ncbi:MAG: SDR family NAD(P)-dependent oxidoreductase, partial [Pirellulaceae bacterium]|nr:SDR family NAD(P)-dependent oxidoreductase [Pirellulaceae bacterium]
MSLPASEPTIPQLFSLRGKVALITGGCGHLGSAMGRGLAEAGASVILTSRDEGKAKEAAALLPKGDGNTHYGLALDPMQPETLPASFAGAVALAGQVDVLVNN